MVQFDVMEKTSVKIALVVLIILELFCIATTYHYSFD